MTVVFWPAQYDSNLLAQPNMIGVLLPSPTLRLSLRITQTRFKLHLADESNGGNPHVKSQISLSFNPFPLRLCTEIPSALVKERCMEVMDSLMETQPSQALGSCHLKQLKPPAIPLFLPLRYINGVLYYIILVSEILTF